MSAAPTSARPPRILLAGSIDDDHNRLLKLSRTYAAAGYQVRFVGMDRLGRRPRHCVVDGLPCEYITGGWGYSNWRLLIGYAVWVIKLAVYCLSVQADVVHAFELDSGLPVALGTSFRRLPFVYDVQDNYDLRRAWPFGLKRLIRWLDSWVIGRAQSVIVPDEIRIVGPFAPHRDKITVIPNCPPDVPPPPALPSRKGRLTVLAMGHLASQRGVDLLLDAVQTLPDIHLLMAGRFPEPWLEAKALASPQVEFRGWLPWNEAVALGYEADVVFAFYDPSYEVNVLANAQKWFDAMMTRTPILSNRELANAWWIEQEDIGYLCQYGDRDQLASTLRRILENPREAREKGGRGRRLYDQKYNWSAMEKRLLEMVGRNIVMDRETAPVTGS